MQRPKKDSKFQAKLEERFREGQRVRGWKLQILLAILLISYSFSQYHKLQEAQLRSWQGALYIFGCFILYLLISNMLDWWGTHLDQRDKQILALRRQLTCFICDASLGSVEKEHLRRLREAVEPFHHGKADDLKVDNFSLISQAWLYWGENGFKWQDDTECTNCGYPRKAHSQSGDCPLGDTNAS